MQLHYHTLATVPLAQVADTFNLAFADYEVKLSITPERLAEKIRTEGIDLDLSTAVYDGDQMVGFILHATEQREGRLLVYNGGTGVVPAYRGKGLVQGMYGFIRPMFQQHSVAACVLECITTNIAAIKTYERLGFTKHRMLHCYKGMPEGDCRHTVTLAGSLSFMDEEAFADCTPTWQHSTAAIRRTPDLHQVYTILQGGQVVAYAVYYPFTSRIKQLAVHRDYRRQGMGTSLLQYLSSQYGELTFTNIDAESASLNGLLTRCGMHNFIQQYEMWNTHMDF